MNAHPEMIELFSPYVDAELRGREAEDFEAHLASCAACRSEYAVFAEAMTLVREVPRYRLPAAFTRRVVARTRNERRRRVARVRELVLPMVPAEVALPVLLIAVLTAAVLLFLLAL